MARYSITGKKVKRNIEAQIAEQGRTCKSLSDDVYSIELFIASLKQEREQAYAELSAIYYPMLKGDVPVPAALTSLREDVQGIFTERQERRKVLEDLMETRQDRMDELSLELEDIDTRLDGIADERVELKQKMDEELDQNPDFNALETTVAQANARLAMHKLSVDELSNLAKKHLPGYNETIFQYLVNIGFQEKGYYPNRIQRNGDKWVEGKIPEGFKESKKIFDYLSLMPDLIREEVEKQHADLDEKTDKMKEYEKAISDKVGLTAKTAEGVRLAEERDRIIRRIGKKQEEYDDYAEKRTMLEQEKGDYQTRIKEKERYWLEHIGDTIRQKLAEGTPSERDDELVAMIKRLETKIEDQKTSSSSTQEARDAAQRHLKGMNKILSDFESSSYSASNSYFAHDFDVNSLFLAYLAGTMMPSRVNSEISDNQHFKEVVTYKSDSYSHSRNRGSNDYGSILSSSRTRTSSSDGSSWGFPRSSTPIGGGFSGGRSVSIGR
ncbi:MAG: hypothetical protein KJ709_01330 [Nanoarchaeota archaeon]|nr:hypothetical protein [Nanoarchaeota archaeon]